MGGLLKSLTAHGGGWRIRYYGLRGQAILPRFRVHLAALPHPWRHTIPSVVSPLLPHRGPSNPKSVYIRRIPASDCLSQAPHGCVLNQCHVLCFFGYSTLNFKLSAVPPPPPFPPSAGISVTTMSLPDGLISYGPDSNCTLELCPVEWSALQYRPSLAASGIFIGLFATTMIIHIVEGIRWQTWGFMACMILGCLDEIIGYVGRIVLHGNPFSFSGFFVNICRPGFPEHKDKQTTD